MEDKHACLRNSHRILIHGLSFTLSRGPRKFSSKNIVLKNGLRSEVIPDTWKMQSQIICWGMFLKLRPWKFSAKVLRIWVPNRNITKLKQVTMSKFTEKTKCVIKLAVVVSLRLLIFKTHFKELVYHKTDRVLSVLITNSFHYHFYHVVHNICCFRIKCQGTVGTQQCWEHSSEENRKSPAFMGGLAFE